MNSDRSDNESDADAFVDAPDTFVEDSDGKPTSYRYSTAILSSIARNAVSMFTSFSDETSQNNSREIPKDGLPAIPEISVTDMSNGDGDGDDEYNSKQEEFIESDDASSNTDTSQNEHKDSITETNNNNFD